MCAPDTQRCSWLSVVILSWYAGAGSGAELPGLCLQHTQTRTAPQQLRHQGKRPSSWWVEFRTSVWLFLFVFLGVVWDYLFIHFCSDFFLLFFEQSFEWLAGIYWTKYLSEAPAVCADTPSPFHKSHTAADILKTLECTRCLRQSDVILFRFHHKDLFKYRIHTEICPMAGLDVRWLVKLLDDLL